MQPDLFDQAPRFVSGFDLRASVISPEAERKLIAEIDRVELPLFRFQGWLGKRRTRSFGWLYDFNGGHFGPTEPIPDFLMPIRALAGSFAGVDVQDLVQASIIKYEAGAGIGWHKDRPELDAVVGISLGAAAIMRFRRRTENGFERVSVSLSPRSIYHLDGEVRHAWEHSIAPGTQTRWSITFRGLAKKEKHRTDPNALNRAHALTASG
ncbi:alpha-ketoglutarate-dependent dioxygenase AlkB [Acidisphaera sp. S103]|uniref:alpha-ketoglutarate-dependent dioxygenase AlkB n=1 Tax=Acidisphaera sp. S103 TaxID=1747223 RepID=UPI00131B8173|nr:alpha-ketoglutarate-dependent dioxygenase AlkB [Acidisphaera sp. S103]